MADLPTLAPGDRDPVNINRVLRQAIPRIMEVHDLAENAAESTTQIIAGTGLTGGGDLSADRTLSIATGGVTNALLADMAEATFKMRAGGAGTGAPIDGTATQARTAAQAEQIGVTAGIVDRTNSTLALSDIGKTAYSNSGSANTITVPPNSSVAFPVNTYINFLQAAGGQTTITAGVGVTLLSYNSALKLAGQNAMATMLQTSTDVWFVGGNLTT